MKFLNELNEEQRQAVEITTGPLIITAGPGTGKTKTLASKIAYLVMAKKVAPQVIIALTFTQKAAAEMKQRVQQLVGTQHPLPFIGTFHALAYDILTPQNGQISLISERKRLEIIREIRAQSKSELSTKDLSLFISRHKAQLASHHPLVERYNTTLRERGLYDFDDLLLEAWRLLQNKESGRKAAYLFIDEFQDTNPVQYALMKLLALEQGHLCVIGDPCQSIYGFRGASPESFHQFKQDFSASREITLRTNYRSLLAIIAASHALFPATAKLETYQSLPGSVTLVTTVNEHTEADWIVAEISRLMGGMDLNEVNGAALEDHIRFSDFAIIYRTHEIGRMLEQRLVESGIPYQVIGGNSLYEQPEIELVTMCLRILQTQNQEQQKILFQELEHVPFRKRIKVNVQQILHDLAPELDGKKLSDIVAHLIQTSQLLEVIADQPRKQRNVQEFISTIVRFDLVDNGLEQFLKYLEYLKEHEYYDAQSDKVTLLTMHAAKGLEFPYVFIAGFEDGLIPYIRSGKENDLDEEKRLLYVAMTRPQQGLYLLEAQRRYKRKTTPSRFRSLLEIPTVEDKAVAIFKIRQAKIREKKRQLAMF